MNYGCIEVYTIINETIVFDICNKLQIESILLSKLKSLRDYNDKLSKKPVIYYLLSILEVNGYKKEIYLILIILLDNYSIILEKL